MLRAEPDDVFLRYTLAMELDSAGDSDESLAIYRGLMTGQPPHVPSFFRTGQLLVRLRRIAEAAATLHQGIALATAQGDLHAASEMSELLQSIAADDDPL
jgi:hypothetical protein